MGSAGATTIRKATLHDMEAVLECLRAAFAPYEHHYTKVAFQDTTLTRESYPDRLREMTVYVALENSDRVIGTIACNAIGNGEGHLRGMAVLPGFQASGVADHLLAHAEQELAQQHCSHVTLDTTEPLQRAMRFYERHGYRRSGKVVDFFGMPLIEYAKVLTVKS
jgi:ribosomal protein S18 acetylase RimI-like enzyme